MFYHKEHLNSTEFCRDFKSCVKNIPGRKAAFSSEIQNHFTKLYWPTSRAIQIGVSDIIQHPKNPTNDQFYILMFTFKNDNGEQD